MQETLHRFENRPRILAFVHCWQTSLHLRRLRKSLAPSREGNLASSSVPARRSCAHTGWTEAAVGILRNLLHLFKIDAPRNAIKLATSELQVSGVLNVTPRQHPLGNVLCVSFPPPLPVFIIINQAQQSHVSRSLAPVSPLLSSSSSGRRGGGQLDCSQVVKHPKAGGTLVKSRRDSARIRWKTKGNSTLPVKSHGSLPPQLTSLQLIISTIQKNVKIGA